MAHEQHGPPPGHSLLIRTVAELRRLTGLSGLDDALQPVLDAYPVRLTRQLLQLVRESPQLARQVLPDGRELQGPGERLPFVGLIPTGARGVERLYPDRCVVMPWPGCLAHCRFCFRRHHEHLGEQSRPLSAQELDAALDVVAGDTRLHEVLISGGEPTLDQRRLQHLLHGLRQPRCAHVGPIRVASRSLVTAPETVDADLIELLARHQDLAAGRPVELAAHINHPDELTPAAIDALCRLRQAGLHVYNQAVLLRGVNSDPEVMATLLWRLRCHGVETYTIFFCEPVAGADHLRLDLASARRLKSELRRRASGRCNPHLIVTTRIGKLELGVDGWEVEREPDGRHVWLRTPYTLEGLRELHAGFQLPAGCRLDAEGHIEARYLDGPPLG